MRIGTLDRRASLRHRVLTKNVQGEDVVSYTEYDTVWARKDDLRGREFFAAQQINAEVTTKFTIRWRDDLLLTDQLECEGVSYNIRQKAEISRRRGLELLTTSAVL